MLELIRLKYPTYSLVSDHNMQFKLKFLCNSFE